MADWWQSLNIYEHIVLTIAVASTIVVLTKIIFDIFKFYSVDKLNSEPENLEKYEKIANNDSDIEVHVPRFVSIISLNVLIMSTCWSYFVFMQFVNPPFTAIFAIFFGLTIFVVYSIIKFWIRRNNKKSQK